MSCSLELSEPPEQEMKAPLTCKKVQTCGVTDEARNENDSNKILSILQVVG